LGRLGALLRQVSKDGGGKNFELASGEDGAAAMMRVPDNDGPSSNVVSLRPNIPAAYFLMAGAQMERSGRLQELAGMRERKVQPKKGTNND
jgi:hypothetical protein